jgi:glycosyltransferase involved in cell wall biosynthesis
VELTFDLPGPRHYLTRFMAHVWKHYRQELNIRRSEAYLEFLTWFALDCIPQWNLPPTFLPDDLLAVLNHPARGESLPLTTAMLVHGRVRSADRYAPAAEAPDELVVAMAFELLAPVLRSGDPRLLPDFVSRFWFHKTAGEPDALNAYEYVAARACAGGGTPDSAAAVRSWMADRYAAVLPEAGLFLRPPAEDARAREPECADLRLHDKAVFVYRDHRSLAGLATAGRFTREALAEAGLPVVDLDFSFGRDRMQEEYAHNAAQPGAGRRSLHILHLNPEYVPECLMSHLARLGGNDTIIGHFAWELSEISSVHECALGLVDEIWVPSRYVKDIYQQRTDLPIFVMGHAVEPLAPNPRYSRAWFGLPTDRYVFLVSFDAGSIVERKNPLGAARAFRKAFPSGDENALLVLKTRNMDACQTGRDREHWREVLELAAADARIRVMEQTMTAAELNALYAACDCYVSLHRSEGFGFGPAEAMGQGRPVLATGYSGVTEFCTAETAVLVGYTPADVPAGAFPFMDEGRKYQWASPDLDAAAFHMRRLYEDPTTGQRLGEAGRRKILDQFSREALRRRFVRRLAELGWL